ncbi:AraC family transcriptional regulator [Mucilaginibacter mali]|uniref:AraC family transcriptional regulator n=1 Tax=Mucilaginibacter mali TaxID=2740462 RepID=A0A7D4UJB0_9SPHI|nr:helix-turn-helix domain-containing protein [Mucilaginibacter mali]QKJ28822.1 AraC family transcriptional regulator [Mucilaginibacter mali]
MLAGFFNIIILMGALQGFIISTLLFFSKKKQLANKLLAAFIFFIALACLNLSISGQKWASSGQVMPLIMAVVPMVVVMPLGPLLFFYTKASLSPNFKLAKKDRLHFATVIIDLFPYLTAIFFIIGVLSGLLRNNAFDVGLFIDNYNVYSDIPRWLSLSIYLTLTIRYVAAFRKTAAATDTPLQLKWLRQLTIAFIIFQSIWLVYLIPYVIPAYGNKLLNAVNWYPIYVPMSILIYWLGVKGYLMMQAQSPVIKKTAATLPDAESAKVISTLKKAMEQDGLYLNPSLNLNLLAQHTGIAQKTISAVLNQYQGKSFNEFINQYRVDAFKQKVCADELKHLTIAGIAAECGFNSQATFQRIFRQFTGLSPSEFKAQAAGDPQKQYSNPDLSTV